jgi:carbamoyl-phosphate synthase large subunit
VRGLMNGQFVLSDGQVWVIEVNPRASRTIPFVSKVTGVPMVDLAVKVMLGETLKSIGYSDGLCPVPVLTGVKVPVFSWAKLTQVDTALGPEMKSTGEVMGIDRDPLRALYKGLRAAGLAVPDSGEALFTVADRDKAEAVNVAKAFAQAGLKIIATPGTQKYLEQHGVPAAVVQKLSINDDILDKILTSQITVVVNTLSHGEEPRRDGFHIRRAAVEHAIPCITSLDTANALARVVFESPYWGPHEVYAVQDFAMFERRQTDAARE